MRRCGGPARWGHVSCRRSELRLELVLRCGQAFRWRESSAGHWTGVLAGRVWTLRQTEERLWYMVHQEEEEEEGSRTEATGQGQELQPRGRDPGSRQPGAGLGGCDAQQILRDYFQLDVGLAGLYQAWGAVDPHFRKVAANFPGVRVLRQDPVECLFSFLCTSNNHLARITGMIERLCRAFGRRLCQLDTEPYHAFPSLQALAGVDAERRLRALGFGYRAKFVSQSAQAVLRQFGAEGLHQLRSTPYPEARRLLCALPGVGAKVADCVCLMALDKAEAVPVDTHIWQIARRDYGLELGSGAQSVTMRVHSELGDFFRRLWGPYAGWAQAVLFCADLKMFRQNPGTSVGTKGGPAPTAASLSRCRPTPALEAGGQDSILPVATGILCTEAAPATFALTGKCHRGASRKRPRGKKCHTSPSLSPQGTL
ncbi:N-glycosylase/DNA lyase [Dermochelys coriacea]|uniref:N-glycosylase/DNA lyase n=1 Tax=Dermochelys coriacea TaxID=27794 RepID=UPI0018E86309|nr:N-glycosylase/DNA lyase [Dermochelys coriacea]